MALPRRALFFLLGLQLAAGAYTNPIPGQLTISPLNTQTLGPDGCRGACTSEGLCRTYAHDSSDNTCKLYNLRAGLGGIALSGHDSTWSYYETTLGERDSMLTALNDRRAAVGPLPGTDGYLAFTREPFNMTLTGATFETVYVASAGECAGQCLRGRGVINDATGVRCKSFEFHLAASSGNLHRCDLLHEDLLTDGLAWEPDDGVQHYERLIGKKCWVYQESCHLQPEKDNVYLPGSGNQDAYETACHSLARTWHDSECRTKKEIPTWAWFGPGGSLSAWNPPDITEGCVIEAGDCPFTPYGRPDGWAQGTFRDSVGEFDTAAFSNARACMDRAEKWHTLCEKPDSDLVYATYVATGARLGFPVPTCECDEVGELVDPTTQFSYCVLNSEDVCKMSDGVTLYLRKEVNDGRPYPEILCEDVETCPRPDDDLNKCRLLDGFRCDNNAYSTNGIKWADLDGPTTEEECFDMAEVVHTACGNYADDYVDVIWTPTRKMKTYPVMDPMYSSVDAIGSYLYNIPRCEDGADWTNCTSFADAGQERWQTFKAPTQDDYVGTPLEENHIRGMGFLWRGEEDAVFTLKIKEDPGFDPTAESQAFVATATLNLDASSDPIWVTVPLDVVLTPGLEYTAVVQVNGEIAYDTSTDYLDGTGDLVWDYLFILWQHALIERQPRPLQGAEPILKDPMNVFQFLFMSMVGVLLAAIMWHHYKKYKKRKQEMEPLYEKVTDEEIVPFHGSTVKSSRSRHDTWRRDLGGDGDLGQSGALGLKPMDSGLGSPGSESSGALDMSDGSDMGSPDPRKSWNMDDDTSHDQPVLLTIEQQQARMLEKDIPEKKTLAPAPGPSGPLFVSPAPSGVGTHVATIPAPIKAEPRRRSTYGPTAPPPDIVPPTALDAADALGIPGETSRTDPSQNTVNVKSDSEEDYIDSPDPAPDPLPLGPSNAFSNASDGLAPGDWPMGSTGHGSGFGGFGEDL